MSDRWTALVAESLAAGLSVRCTATGQSMEPAILDGETVILEPIMAGDLEPGMVVLAVLGERALIHRVIDVVRDANGAVARVRTRGDALPGDDPEGKPQDVRGRAVAVLRGGAELPLSLVPVRHPRRSARLAFLVITALSIMALIVLRGY